MATSFIHNLLNSFYDIKFWSIILLSYEIETTISKVGNLFNKIENYIWKASVCQ